MSYQQPAPQPRNGFGTSALVLGILAALFAFVPIVGMIAFPLAILALILGILGVRRATRREATNRGAALAGTILGGAGLAVAVTMTVATGAALDQVERDLNQAGSNPAAQLTQAAPAPEPEAPAEPEPGTIPGEGTFVVGEDVEPGTYRTDGPADSLIPNCYWARLSGLSGGFDELIANQNSEGPTTVTIKDSDAAFKVRGCQTWEKVN